MPRKNKFEVLKELKPSFPYPPVLNLSMHPSEQYADKAVKVKIEVRLMTILPDEIRFLLLSYSLVSIATKSKCFI
jgi:DNA-binding NarL/FixJ family response regulator